MVRQGILEPVEPGGITNASPVVWQRKKSEELSLCVDLKVHINGKVMDEDYSIPDMDTIFHNLHVASYFGKIDLSDAYYQIELNEEAKDIYTINTSQGLFKMCRLLQGLKNSSSSFQNCIESTLKGIKGVVIFQDDVLVYGTTNEQFDKRMLAVKSRLRGKNITINEKKSNSKPVDSVSFLGYSISKEGIAPHPKNVEKTKNAKAPTNNKQLQNSDVGLSHHDEGSAATSAAEHQHPKPPEHSRTSTRNRKQPDIFGEPITTNLLIKERGCDGFKETSRNLEVFSIKVSKNKRRT